MMKLAGYPPSMSTRTLSWRSGTPIAASPSFRMVRVMPDSAVAEGSGGAPYDSVAVTGADIPDRRLADLADPVDEYRAVIC